MKLNKKIFIPLFIQIIFLITVLISARDVWVDESFSYLLSTQYPFSYWFATTPFLYLLSTIFFLLIPIIITVFPKKEDKKWVILTITLLAILATTSLAIAGLNPKDAHAPVYFTLLHYWTLIFGTTTIAMRSLSSIFIIAALIAFWRYCERYHGEQVALIATSFFAISSNYLYYGTETRMYAILIFISILATTELKRIIDNEVKPGFYALLIIIMANLHYFTAIFLFFQMGILLWHRKKQEFKQVLMLITFSLIPLVTYFLMQKARIVQMYLKQPTLLSWISSINSSLNKIDSLQPLITSPWTLIFTILIFALITLNLFKKDKWTDSEYILATTPQIIGIILSILMSVWNVRYFLITLWLIPVLLAQTIVTIYEKRRFLAVFIFILTFTFILYCTAMQTPDTELQTCGQALIKDAGNNNITILHETPFSALPERFTTRNYPNMRHITLFKGYTNLMKNSMNGDTTERADTFYFAQALPHIDYYFEHDGYISTQNMTLIMDCSGLRLWKQN